MSNTHPNCITLVCNLGYLDHALFVAGQLLKQPNRHFDIVICSEDDFSGHIPAKISFQKINAETFTDKLPTIERLGKYAYWRIPAIEILAQTYEKIVYLDTDVFVNGADIGELFDIDLGNYAIAAVRDVHQLTKPKRMPRECKILNKPWIPYFNSGVLLVNALQWRVQQCFNSITSLCRNASHALACHDQSLLNLMCDGKWLEISPVWNWQYSYKNCFLTEYVSPKLVHIAGEKKIWHTPNGTLPRKYWEAYQLDTCETEAKLTIDAFPQWDDNMLKELSRRLIKNLFYLRSYKKYLAQFPNDTAVIKHN